MHLGKYLPGKSFLADAAIVAVLTLVLVGVANAINTPAAPTPPAPNPNS